MSMLNIAKKLKHLEKCELTEAKADTQRLIDFAGQDLADRFIAIKNKIKSPENDLYYWVKNKTPAEFEQFIASVENIKSNSAIKKEIADHGAELVSESEHWKIYHITTFEASQKYGRDSQWCITGVNNGGSAYWDQYTAQGVKFYFAIAKENYDSRGLYSKFAFAVFPGGDEIELYDQQDNRASLEDIPYYSEITIPGVNLNNISVVDYDEEPVPFCDRCGADLTDDEWELYETPYGDHYCEDCFYEFYRRCEDCGEVVYIDDAEDVNGNWYCDKCAPYYTDDENNDYFDESVSILDEFKLYDKLWE